MNRSTTTAGTRIPHGTGRHRAPYLRVAFSRDRAAYFYGTDFRRTPRHRADTPSLGEDPELDPVAEVRAELDTPIDLAAVRVGLSMAGVA